MLVVSRLVPAVVLAGLVLSIVPTTGLRGAPPAAEEDVKIYTTIDNEELLEIMSEAGYTASVNEKGTVIWRLEGHKSRCSSPAATKATCSSTSPSATAMRR